MKAEKFEFSNSKWELGKSTQMPAVLNPQPMGKLVTFKFLSAYGSSGCEIQSIKVQNDKGEVMDNLIQDKWFLNPKGLPREINFTLSTEYSPTFIIIENGIAAKGVKEMEVHVNNVCKWRGEIPMATPENRSFSIAIPIESQSIHRRME